MVVIIPVFLAGAGLVRPRRGCFRRVAITLNGYAAAIGAFNAAFKTNYMFLCEKPQAPTLLDWFGPWPVYLIAVDGVALLVFALLWLPVRGRATNHGG
jgi:uncharacterized membrane protein YwaF